MDSENLDIKLSFPGIDFEIACSIRYNNSFLGALSFMKSEVLFSMLFFEALFDPAAAAILFHRHTVLSLQMPCICIQYTSPFYIQTHWNVY